MAGGGEKRVSQKKSERKTEQDGNKELSVGNEKETSLPGATGVAGAVGDGGAGVDVANASAKVANEASTLGQIQDGGEAAKSAGEWWSEVKADMEGMVRGLEERMVKSLEERLVKSLEKKMVKSLENFREDIEERVVRNLENFREDIRRDLQGMKEEIQGQVSGLASEVRAAEERVSGMEERIRGLEEGEQDVMAELTRLGEENENLRAKVTDVEARSRRSNLRCFGVEEGAEKENVTEFMTELIKGEFDSLREVDLGMQRCHRALGPIPGLGATPRSIVMFFQDFRIKEKVLAEAWTKGRKVMYGGKRLYFDHDYPAETLEKRKKYAPIRKCLSENKIKFSTPPPAKMKVFFKEGTETYTSAEEAREKLTAKGFTIEEPPTARRGAAPATGTRRDTWQRAGKDKDGDVKRRQRIREKLRVFVRD